MKEKRRFNSVIAIALTLFATAFMAGCSGGSGDLKSFLADAEGDWYLHGNSQSERLRIAEDGAWEFQAAVESESERVLINSGKTGSISYDTEFEVWTFKGESKSHSVLLTEDGLLTFDRKKYVPAQESRDLNEFDGKWYEDGDSNKNYYSFSNGDWVFMEGGNGMWGGKDKGYLIYRGGQNRTLTATDDFGDTNIKFSIGDDEIKTGNKSYVRL